MLDLKDTTYYNLKGIQINDPSVNYDDTLQEGMEPCLRKVSFHG